MRKILILFLSIVHTIAFAQTYNTLPTGSKPYGTQPYLFNGNILMGTSALKFRLIPTKEKVDSLLALKAPISPSGDYVQSSPSTTQNASINVLGNVYSETGFQTAGYGLKNNGSAVFGNTVTNDLSISYGANKGALRANNLTSDREYQLPDASGKLALESQIPVPTTLERLANKGQINGYASLDASGKVPLTQVNDVLLGAVNYQGNYNASNNTPALPAATGNKGKYYVVTNSGTQQGLNFNSGDWIISNGTIWEKVDNNNKVASVNGRIGAVSELAELNGGNNFTGNQFIIGNQDIIGNQRISGINTVDGDLFVSNNLSLNRQGTAFVGATVNNLGPISVGALTLTRKNSDTVNIVKISPSINTSQNIDLKLPTESGKLALVSQIPTGINDGSLLNNVSASSNYWNTKLIGDFNSITGYGLLEAGGVFVANQPELNQWGQGIQFSANNNPNYVNQLVFSINGGLYTRSKVANTWGGWKNILTSTTTSPIVRTGSGIGLNLTNTSDADLQFEISNVGAVNKFAALSTSTENTPLILQQFGGKVGIGTLTPQAKLDVNGSVSGASFNLPAKTNTNAFSIGSDEAAKFFIYDNTTGIYRLNIANNGNVGINKVTPESSLDVSGDIGLSNNLIFKGANDRGLTFINGGNSNAINSFNNGLDFYTGVNQYIKRLRIESDGSMSLSGNLTVANPYAITSAALISGNVRVTGGLTIENPPSASANNWEILARNTGSGVVGKFSASIADLGYRLQRTVSSNGSSTTISIPHGLSGITPASFAIAVANSDASGGIHHVTIDSTNVNVFYTVAPASGTNNLTYSIEVRP